jgi:hypothetical protein
VGVRNSYAGQAMDDERIPVAEMVHSHRRPRRVPVTLGDAGRGARARSLRTHASAHRQRSLRSWTLVVAMLAATTAGVVKAAPASAAPSGLVVSTSSSRTNPQTLEAATLKGNAYIFVTGYSTARQVRFSLDGGSSVTRSYPFDFAGGRSSRANALDTTRLSDGPHTLTAVVLSSSGKVIARLSATFAVANQVAPPLPPPPPTPSGTWRILVPAYFYPGEQWTRMCGTLPSGSIAVMNPSSGPGTATDAAYTAVINDCRAKGIGVIGYVHTSYGSRSASTVRADVDAYFARYAVTGIFFDEASTDSATQSYYAGLHEYVHSKSAGALTVVTNPGAAAATSWQLDGATADIVTVFEGSPSQFATWTPPAWVGSQNSSRLATIVYASSTQAAMEATCGRAKTLNLGWSYVTSDVLPNPFDTLPTDSYWSAELTACT